VTLPKRLPIAITLLLHELHEETFHISRKRFKENHADVKCYDYRKSELNFRQISTSRKINWCPLELIKSASSTCLVRVESRVPRSSWWSFLSSCWLLQAECNPRRQRCCLFTVLLLSSPPVTFSATASSAPPWGKVIGFCHKSRRKVARCVAHLGWRSNICTQNCETADFNVTRPDEHRDTRTRTTLIHFLLTFFDSSEA